MDIDLAALPEDVDTLQQLVRTMAAERAEERSELSEAQSEIARLKLIVQKLQRHEFGRRAERLDPGQMDLGLEDLAADIAAVETRLPASKIKEPATRSGSERASLPDHLEREDRCLDIEGRTCPCCGGPLHAIGETVSEMLDYVPARLRLRPPPAILPSPSVF